MINIRIEGIKMQGVPPNKLYFPAIFLSHDGGQVHRKFDDALYLELGFWIVAHELFNLLIVEHKGFVEVLGF